MSCKTYNSEDLQFGLESEDKVLKLLKEKINKNITQNHKYHPFDYFCSETNTFFELKTRRNKHDEYPDTMCGANKLKFARNHPTNKYVFLFSFIDGLYYHNFEKNKKYDMRPGGRCDRGRVELSNYFYIKKEDLISL